MFDIPSEKRRREIERNAKSKLTPEERRKRDTQQLIEKIKEQYFSPETTKALIALARETDGVTLGDLEHLAYEIELTAFVTEQHAKGRHLHEMNALNRGKFLLKELTAKYKELGFRAKPKSSSIQVKESTYDRIAKCHQNGLTLNEAIAQLKLSRRTIADYGFVWPKQKTHSPDGTRL